ncbi:MAG TPA: hypothetical protein VGH28_00390 [Polyangiaceae bacterium]|jgi:hypothetical protein
MRWLLLSLGFALACAKPLTGDECEAYKHKVRVLEYADTGRSPSLAKEEAQLLASPTYKKSESCPQISRAQFECAQRAKTEADLSACPK